MTNSHEPSYYEIALTNRQVVVAFVILLICLVSAFFSGLWIGRESTARAQERIVRSSPAVPAVPQEGQDLEELQFFEDGQPQEGGARPGAAPGPAATPQDTTLLEDLGGEPEDAVLGGDPALPEGRRREGRGADETPENTPEEAPSPTPARPQPDAAPNSSEPRLTATQKVIQVFSSPELDQAEKVRDRLARGGHQAYLSPVQVAGRTMYRVRIGPFDSREAAQKVAEEVRKSYKLDTWVTE